MNRVRVCVIAALCALVLSSCSLVSPDASPQHIARTSVGFGLLNKTIPGTDHVRVRFTTQPVYVIDATNHLSPLSAIVPSPPALATVIEQLLIGPTRIEKSAGFGSALSTKLILASATIRHAIGYVNLATPFDDPTLARQILAEGQLVLTAFDVGATRGIVIQVAGVTQDEPLPNGHHASLLSENEFTVLLNG
ncbi:MAG: GerMN domain-containing protein [Acidimicrobiales bacterium]